MEKCINKLILLFFFTVLTGKVFTQEIIQVSKDSELALPLSYIADKVTPIYLASFEGNIGNIAQINKDKENIFISDIESNIVYRFNIEGEFINFIGLSELRQEEGYKYTSGFCLDTIEKKVLLLTDKGVYTYNYDGVFLNKKSNIIGREIQLIGDYVYVNLPRLNRFNKDWKAKKIIRLYTRDSLKLRYNITYSNATAEPYISVLRNRTPEYTFSQVGENIYVYQPEFIGRLQVLQNTVFSLSKNILIPHFNLEFENPYINRILDILIKNIFLTKRFIFCEFERLRDETSMVFCHDLETGIGLTTSQGFWDDIENTGTLTRLSPISTNENLFFFFKGENYSENQDVILYLVELKN